MIKLNGVMIGSGSSLVPVQQQAFVWNFDDL